MLLRTLEPRLNQLSKATLRDNTSIAASIRYQGVIRDFIVNQVDMQHLRDFSNHYPQQKP